MSRISIGAELYPQYSQAVDDEQGMRLIGCAFNDQALAKVGIADTPGAYIVTRWVTEWKRETLNPIEAVQAAVVAAINTLGITLLGSEFKPITSSPIPDDEVAQILRAAVVAGQPGGGLHRDAREQATHTPVYAQGRCSCGWRPTALTFKDSPETWDTAVDRHISEVGERYPEVSYGNLP